MSEVTLHLGDSAQILKGFAPDCIDLTVTSPPYDNLRTYDGYIGFDFETIAQELYRVTKPGGVVVWVVGDATINGSETGTSFRQALYFMGCGFNLHDTMIYQAAGTGAKGSHDAYWQGFEYMLVLTKGKIATFHPLRDQKNLYAGRDQGTSPKADRVGSRQKDGGYTTPEFSIRTNLWKYQPGNNGDDTTEHPAPFPESLAGDHILSWSNPGDIVLDCFLGSGTTGKMAMKYQRNFIGIEISEKYLTIAQCRIHDAQQQMHLFEAV
jgi:site-specific DNA-methyltransferase (adenine-specific)